MLVVYWRALKYTDWHTQTCHGFFVTNLEDLKHVLCLLIDQRHHVLPVTMSIQSYRFVEIPVTYFQVVASVAAISGQWSCHTEVPLSGHVHIGLLWTNSPFLIIYIICSQGHEWVSEWLTSLSGDKETENSMFYCTGHKVHEISFLQLFFFFLFRYYLRFISYCLICRVDRNVTYSLVNFVDTTIGFRVSTLLYHFLDPFTFLL